MTNKEKVDVLVVAMKDEIKRCENFLQGLEMPTHDYQVFMVSAISAIKIGLEEALGAVNKPKEQS